MIIDDPVQDARTQASTYQELINRRIYFGDKEKSITTMKPSWRPRSLFVTTQVKEWKDIEDDLRTSTIEQADIHSNHLIQLFYGESQTTERLPLNLSRGLRSIKKRIENKELIVCLCDKNLGFAVVSRSAYINTCLEHLEDRSTYKQLGYDTIEMKKKLRLEYTTELKELLRVHVEEKTGKLLIQATEQAIKSSQIFKILIKIHKMAKDLTKLISRPITPAVGYYTSPLSRFLSDLFVQVLPLIPSYVRDATDTAQKLIVLECGKEQLYSITGDIPSMFTNVPMGREDVGLVIDYILEMVRKKDTVNLNKWPSRTFLIEAVILVCKYNLITGPDNKLYLQIYGLAMGTSLAAAFASLSIAAREGAFLSFYGHHFITWLRFADDIYALSNTNKESLLRDVLPSFCIDEPKLNAVPWEIDIAEKDAIFLDARVSLCDSRIKGKRLMVTRVYQKDLALYQYLPFISWHLPHMVRSWVASETQRYARLCFYRHDFTEITKLFKSRLMARGYPPHVVDEEIAKVDYDSVQHETLHMEVKLPDCALCNAQAATHPNPIAPNLNLDHYVETHKSACFDPESEGDSGSKTKKKIT